jgi:hypothetical protein
LSNQRKNTEGYWIPHVRIGWLLGVRRIIKKKEEEERKEEEEKRRRL